MNIKDKALGVLLGKKNPDKARRPGSRDILENELDHDTIAFNVYGFLPVTRESNVEEIIQNVGYILSEDSDVCILDIEDCFPRMLNIFGEKYGTRDKGLQKLLLNDKEDIKNHIIKTKYDRLYLLAFSEMCTALENMSTDPEFTIASLFRVVNDLNERFDYTLINIPSNLYSDFLLGGLKCIDEGFIVFNQQSECYDNFYRMNAILANTELKSTSKISKALVSNYLDIGDTFTPVENLGLRVVSVIPQLSSVVEKASEGEVYLASIDSADLDEDYLDSINHIVESIKH